MRTLSTLWLVFLTGCTVNSLPESSPAPAAIPFSAVQALTSREPDGVLPYGAAPQQFAELWLPATAAPAAGFPVVIFLHGGCWLNTFGIEHTRPAAQALAALGYAVWSLEYRRVGDPGGGWPGSLEDVLSGMALLFATPPAQLDLQRVAIAGHSAGGHLALLAASQLYRAPPSEGSVRGVLGLAAITDIDSYARGESSCQQATQAFMGGTGSEVDYRPANPARQPLHPGSLLLAGANDAIVPGGQAAALGLDPVIVEGAGHFDFIYPGSGAWRAFASALQEMLHAQP